MIFVCHQASFTSLRPNLRAYGALSLASHLLILAVSPGSAQDVFNPRFSESSLRLDKPDAPRPAATAPLCSEGQGTKGSKPCSVFRPAAAGDARICWKALAASF